MYIAITGSKNNEDVYIIVPSAKKTEKPLHVFIKNSGSTMPFWNSLMGIKTS